MKKRLLSVVLLLPVALVMGWTASAQDFSEIVLSSASAVKSATGSTVTITGSGFVEGSVIQWNATPLRTTYVSSSRLLGDVPTAVTVEASDPAISVANPGGLISNNIYLVDTANADPSAPVITSINPTSASAGSTNLSITINGSGFFGGTAVLWDGDIQATLTPTSFTSTQLQVTVPADLLQTSGTASISASNPGGVVSNAVTFTINPAGSGGGTSLSLNSLTPNSAVAGGPAFTLTVNGAGFVSGATVRWNGSSLTTTFVSSTQLTASVSAALIQTSGSANIVVSNPGGAVSSSLSFTISSTSGGGTTVTISSLSPNAATAGGAGFTMTVNGTGFVSSSVVGWNGSALPTTFMTATQLSALVPPALIQTAGSASIVVTNPGGVASGAATFTINAAGSGGTAPALSSLNPNSDTAGGAGFNLTVSGTGFVSGATVVFNGSVLSTTFVNATQLFALVPAVLIQTSGSVNVTVTNPGSSPSGALAFNIVPASGGGTPPVISVLNPSSATAGGAGFPLTVSGSGFVSASIVGWNGSALPTTFVSTTQLIALVPATLIQISGSANVTVTNPGSTASGALAFTIGTGGTSLAISALSPNSVTAGGPAFAITVTGTNFVSGATVGWNGTAVPTVFVSATQVAALISPLMIQTAGSVNITVTNPSGTTSGGLTFTILTAGTGGTSLSISTLTPNSANAGTADFTLTVGGNGFVSGATVQWNGSNLTTTFVNAAQLTAAVPAALIQNAGSVSIVVSNPGGATSGAAVFTITPAGYGLPPAITALNPNSATVGGPAFTLSVTGTGFVAGSTVQWNGSSLTTAFLTPTLLTATVSASLIQTIGSASVVVFNPDGTAFAPVAFVVGGIAPALTALTPASTTPGQGAITLCAAGARFASGAVLQWNGSSLTTAVLSDSLACATVPANLTATSSTATITVTNPGSAASNSLLFNIAGPPVITPGGVVPVYSSVPIIEPGSWISIYGTNLANGNYTWNGDFPTSLGGVTVTINGKPAYLWSVTPGQINVQAPDDSARGIVSVVVSNAIDSATSSVTLASYGPSFSLLPDGKHAVGVIPSLTDTGAYGGGSYDLVGPSDTFPFTTRPVKAGETLVLYGVGFGPTMQPVPAGEVFSGASPTATPVSITIGGVPADVAFAGMTEAGLYQFNVTVPAVPGGDQPLQAIVNGVQTIAGPVVTVQ